MKTYQSPFHATLPKDETDKARTDADYTIHNRDVPLSRPTSRRNAWSLIPVIKA
jgi:hypothetical protein